MAKDPNTDVLKNIHLELVEIRRLLGSKEAPARNAKAEPKRPKTTVEKRDLFVGDDDPIEIEVVSEKEKAYRCVAYKDSEDELSFWLPKSQIEDIGGGDWQIPEWLGNKIGL